MYKWNSRNRTCGYDGSTVSDIGRGSSGISYSTSGEGVKRWEAVRNECLQRGKLWEDPDFPANDRSAFFAQRPPKPLVWKRASEICQTPVMFDADGGSRLDINQGRLGDSWLVTAISSLATRKDLLHHVVPVDQNFNKGNYAGVFRFNIWQYGHWVEVLIDDLLPTNNGKLMFVHSKNGNEFWTALLEKAYAKLCGSYEALKMGEPSEALTDFTGGVTEKIPLGDKTPDDLLPRMFRAHSRFSLMACSISPKPNEIEAKLDNGLVLGQGYSITDVRMVKTPQHAGGIAMVRLRCPWGNEREWNGAWSDKSSEWRSIPDAEKQAMGLVFDDDGEFWMAFGDFTKEFNVLQICYLGPDTILEQSEKNTYKTWQGQLAEGSWRKAITAGGSKECRDTFHINMKFGIQLDEPDEGDADGKSTIIVALMQKDRRRQKHLGKQNLTIGYYIYKLDKPSEDVLDESYFQRHQSVARSGNYWNTRENCGVHSLPAGNYVIMPTTFDAHMEGDFILRVFGQKLHKVNELGGETTVSEPDESLRENAPLTANLVGMFQKVGGVDREVDAYELSSLLTNVFKKELGEDGFSADLCKGIVACFDSDMSGKLRVQDFANLMTDCQMYKKLFAMSDKDRSGDLPSTELRSAFYKIGIQLATPTFGSVVLRYCNKEGKLKIDGFLASVTKIKCLVEWYKKKSAEGSISCSLDEFLQMAIYS